MAAVSACTGLDLLGVATRLLLGTVLFAAGSLKLTAGEGFTRTAQALGIPLGRLTDSGLRTLPVIELVLGGWLLTGIWPAPALGLTVLLFAAFSLVVLALLRSGYRGPCACFGVADRHAVGMVQVGRNVVLVAASGLTLARVPGHPCLAEPAWSLLPAAALSGAMLFAGGVTYVLAGEIEGFFRNARGGALFGQEGGEGE